MRAAPSAAPVPLSVGPGQRVELLHVRLDQLRHHHRQVRVIGEHRIAGAGSWSAVLPLPRPPPISKFTPFGNVPRYPRRTGRR
ncbi:hypothetical protein GS447_08295 [Rhodococcus hoagii]|nr:hypothetical protein [Prescottella equi]